MATLWFVLIVLLLTAYVVADGYDIGAGIVHLFVARGEAERGQVLRSIGPLWDGNEVWLLATGPTILLAFPALFAAALSGFYLPLLLVVWLLIGRGCAIELRHQSKLPTWRRFWDAIFAVSSVLLALSLGIALGNVVRGVPLDAKGEFFEPLWAFGDETDKRTGILDGYTLLAGFTVVGALGLHGALWVAMRLEGPPHERARRLARVLTLAVSLLIAALTVATFILQPHVPQRFREAPWGVVFPAVAALGLGSVLVFQKRGEAARAFLGSATFLAGMMASVAFGLYPYVLPSSGDPALGLTAEGTASPDHALRTALWWWLPGVGLALAYQVFAHRLFREKVRAEPGA